MNLSYNITSETKTCRSLSVGTILVMLSDTTSPGQWRKQAPFMNVTMTVGGVLQDYVAAAAECRS